MDIDKYLIPEFDFSRLDYVEFEVDPDVTLEELTSVFKDKRTRAGDETGFPIEANRWRCTGFSHRHRCIQLMVTTNDDGKYVIISFNLLDQYGIELLWCKKP